MHFYAMSILIINSFPLAGVEAGALRLRLVIKKFKISQCLLAFYAEYGMHSPNQEETYHE